MRRQHLLFTSMLGIVSLTIPASAQVLKGSQPADTKPQSTMKASKTTNQNAAVNGAAHKKPPRVRALADGSSKDPAFKSSKTAPRPDALTVKQTNRVDTNTSGGTIKPELGDGSVRSKAATTDIVATSGALNTNHGSARKVLTKKAAPAGAASPGSKKKTVKQTTQPN